MHQPRVGVPVVADLMQRDEREIDAPRRQGAPADDTAREQINHERDVRYAAPRRYAGEIRDPQLIRLRSRVGSAALAFCA